MTEIYIQGSWIEIFSSFRYKYQISDIASLVPKNNISNRFFIYRTKENNELMDWVGDLQNGSRLPYVNIECKLRNNDDIVISDGICIIDEITTDKIHLVVKDGNAFFFDFIKGKSINDLDFSDLDFIWIMSYFEDNRTSEILPVFLDYDFGLTDKDKAHQLPFLPLKVIFEKIISEAGYTYDFDFKDNEDFKNIWLSMVDNLVTENSKNEAKEQVLEIIAFKNSAFWGLKFIDFNYYYKLEFLTHDSHPIWVTQFTVKHDGFYKIDYRVEITCAAYGSYIKIVGGDVAVSTGLLWSGYNVKEGSWTVDLKIGDKIFMYVVPNGENEVVVNNGSYLKLDELPDYENCVYGEKYPISKNLPDILQSDIIKFVMNLYNERVNYENENIEFLDYNKLQENIAKGVVTDWSDKHKDILPLKFHHNFAKKNIIKYANTENKQGYFEIENEQIVATQTLYTLPVDSESSLSVFTKEVENEGEADERNVYNFSSLSKAVMVKRSLSDYSKDYIAEDNSLNLTTNIPDIELIDLQDYIDTYWEFFKNTIENYKEQPLNIWLNQVDINNMDYSEPIFIKYKGYFFAFCTVFEEGKKTKVQLIQINVNPFIPDLINQDWDERDWNKSDWQ